MRKRWPWLLAGGSALAIAGVVAGVVAFVGDLNASLNDLYGAMNIGEALVVHVETTGTWPANWDELRQTFLGPDYKGPKSEAYFEVIRERVWVRFDVTLEELAAAPNHETPPFPVVGCYSGSPAGPTSGHDANLIVFEYLTHQATPEQP